MNNNFFKLFPAKKQMIIKHASEFYNESLPLVVFDEIKNILNLPDKNLDEIRNELVQKNVYSNKISKLKNDLIYEIDYKIKREKADKCENKFFDDDDFNYKITKIFSIYDKNLNPDNSKNNPKDRFCYNLELKTDEITTDYYTIKSDRVISKTNKIYYFDELSNLYYLSKNGECIYHHGIFEENAILKQIYGIEDPYSFACKYIL